MKAQDRKHLRQKTRSGRALGEDEAEQIIECIEFVFKGMDDEIPWSEFDGREIKVGESKTPIFVRGTDWTERHPAISDSAEKKLEGYQVGHYCWESRARHEPETLEASGVFSFIPTPIGAAKKTYLLEPTLRLDYVERRWREMNMPDNPHEPYSK
jgi:hypothetical protein